MASTLSALTVVIVAVILAITDQVCSQNVFVVSPNTFRLETNETVVIYSHSGVQEVTVSVADCPGKKKTFFSQKLKVNSGAPQTVEVRVNQGDIPDLNITGPLDQHFVYLMVNGDKFAKEFKVPVTLHSGYIFIQTDKPIYTPKQSVNMRIIRLDEEMVADNQTFTLQIRNPQNTIVESIPNKDLKNENGMYSHLFNFPKYPLMGDWSVTIMYGVKIKVNSTVKFELRKYVLPTFEVEVECPHVILPDDKLINLVANAKYVFGKQVEGFATFKLKVKLETGHTEAFGSCDRRRLVKGRAECTVSTEAIQKNAKIGWFPGINGARLLVETIVFEESSGFKENKTSDSTIFASTPYLITFYNSLADFKPGLDTSVQARVTYANKSPAKGVQASIKVIDGQNHKMEVALSTMTSNNEGLLHFVIKTSNKTDLLKVTVQTEDKVHPSEGHHTLFPYQSKTNNSYIGIDRTHSDFLNIGPSKMSVYTNPRPDIPLSYLVISKGRIVKSGSLLQTQNQRSFDFHVTADMAPSARVVIFAVHENQILADSLKFRVEKTCRDNGKITVQSDLNNKKPGGKANITLTGKPNTVVGIAAVDQAVFVLRNKDKLTKNKMFDEMERHDLGCGPGGGLDSAAVLANAGVIVISDTVTLDVERKSCAEKQLRKRAIREEITRQHGTKNRKCCEIGKKPDVHKRTCEVRADIIRKFEGPEISDKEACAGVFLKCCQEHLKAMGGVIVMASQKSVSVSNLGRSANQLVEDELDFPSENELEELLTEEQERKDFKETWLFTTHVIGHTGTVVFPSSIPHSITTWVIQAVGLSGKGGGMCVAEPAKLVAFKDVFMDVKMPYDVVKNEQIEIPVTVFNYGDKKLPVFVYTYGVEGVCSDAQPGEKSEMKRIYVNANSAVTTAFQIIPLEAREHSLKFVAASMGGSDVVTKTLSVIPEGVVHEESFSFSIDPSNTEKRPKRNSVNENTQITFDSENKKQSSIVKMKPVFEFIVDGTEYGIIEAIGDKFGPTIHTSLENPDKLLNLPQGCGEQTMMYMAPTVSTFHYLKATGKITPDQEAKAYKFIRHGYNREQTYRKPDGSYAAWIQRPSSTWLTAFVAKVFCQAGKYIFIDENVVCSALRWIVTQQKPDGSFIEKSPVIHTEMKGGVNGDVPLTAFVVMAFEQCDCNSVNLENPIKMAIDYLLNRTATINDHYSMAITAYALALHNSELASDANEKLLRMASHNPELNVRYWGDGKSALSVEASSYALLTQVLYGDMDKATSIVNWLNTQRKSSGVFKSTQDTVIAIEALAEYSLLSRDSDMSLVLNITSTTDSNFKETWAFQPHNARVKRQTELSKIGGRLVVEAQGSGVGHFGVRLRYNIANSPDKICKFDMNVSVSVAQEKIVIKNIQKPANEDDLDLFPDDLQEEMGVLPAPQAALAKDNPKLGRAMADGLPAHFANRNQNLKPFVIKENGVLHLDDVEDEKMPRFLFKRQVADLKNDPKQRSKHFLNLTICTRYLNDKDTGMAIIDVGMLTGYKAVEEDLKTLVNDDTYPIDRFEENGRNLIFYLDKISHSETFCFSFRIEQNFIVSNLESGLVRVYDYYEPDQACSQFYRTETGGPVLKKDCTDKVCKCAEGGCPAKSPFKSVSEIDNKKIGLKREKLTQIACNENDYFWKVKVVDKKTDQSSFVQYEMEVLKVNKEGQEKREDVVRDIRKFVGRKTCETSNLVNGTTYYIMGTDKLPREQADGEIKFVYFIDKSTLIQEWLDERVFIKKSRKLLNDAQRLQKVFSFVETKFEANDGCND